MTSSARYSGPFSENPAIAGVGTRHPGAYAWAVISTTLAPRMTNAQKMNEWSTPAYHSRATFRWKIPYTTKFLSRVGRWSHRGSFRCAVNRYRRRRYIFRPKIERETARKTVTAIVSRAVNTMRSRGTRVPFSTRGCCEDDQLAVVCRYGLPLPSAPDADHPPTRLAENRNEVLRREEEELHRRLGAVLQVLADASRGTDTKWRRSAIESGIRSFAAWMAISFGSTAVTSNPASASPSARRPIPQGTSRRCAPGAIRSSWRNIRIDSTSSRGGRTTAAGIYRLPMTI